MDYDAKVWNDLLDRFGEVFGQMVDEGKLEGYKTTYGGLSTFLYLPDKTVCVLSVKHLPLEGVHRRIRARLKKSSTHRSDMHAALRKADDTSQAIDRTSEEDD